MAPMRERHVLERLALPSRPAACRPLTFPFFLSLRPRRLPNQPWGRKGIRPFRRLRFLRIRRRPRRAATRILRAPRLPRFAIMPSGPGPLSTGAGGSLRASWAGDPA